jgi:hypothetical protein
MTENVQHIRRSQFVTTYGPGAIIEGRYGPRVILMPDIGLGRLFSQALLEKFEIPDIRMTYLVNGARIFALPTNASLNKNEAVYIYRTREFPAWRICTDIKKHQKSVLYNGENKGGKCPGCGNTGEPVRFIIACPEGHMDDIPWEWAIHGKEKELNCQGWFYWHGGGSSVKNIDIECPTCHNKITMGDIYGRNWRCTERFPEREYSQPWRPGRCGSDMTVIQRQATNLRIPEVLTLLTIPKYDTRIARIIQGKTVINLLNSLEDVDELDEAHFRKGLEKKLQKNEILSETHDIIDSYISNKGWEEFLNLYRSILPKDSTNKYKDMLQEEFRSLLNASETGYTSESCNFSMKKFKEFITILPSGKMTFRIAGIDVLRTVTVQKGYRRMPYLKSEDETGSNPFVPIQVTVPSSGEKWLPGFESLCEGIFITASENPLNIPIPAVNEWNIAEPDSLIGDIFRGDDVRNPVFVWWHTLCHALIRTLSLYSGYSSSALRERIYFDNLEGQMAGGILIYTTMGGEDGGMGGLTGTVNSFDEILKGAIDSISLCSNDPLCGEQRIAERNCNGAACHSCLLISETSCEHRNMWLDRHLIIGD